MPSFAAPPPPPTLQPQLSPQPIDHIFIADGVGGKKASGKKVNLVLELLVVATFLFPFAASMSFLYMNLPAIGSMCTRR